MIEPDWQANTTTPRTWLGIIQPVRRGEADPYSSYSSYEWGAELDAAIAALRASHPDVDALFIVAETGGLAITPAWSSGGVRHPLMEIAHSSDDSNWIMVGEIDSDGDFNCGMSVDRPDYAWAPAGYERHLTPSWSIRVTHHA